MAWLPRCILREGGEGRQLEREGEVAGMDGGASETKLAVAMSMAGRAARACDVCGKERARWYCAADEAYLCEHCDGSVHSANALSRRHERVRLAPNGAPMKIDRRSADATGRPRKDAPQPAAPPAAISDSALAPARNQHQYQQGTWQRGYSKKRSRSGRRRSQSLAQLTGPLLDGTRQPGAEFIAVKEEPESPALHSQEETQEHEVPSLVPEDYLELPVVSMSSNACFQDVLSCSQPLSWLNTDDDTAASDDGLEFLVSHQGECLEDSQCLDTAGRLSEVDAGMTNLMDDSAVILNAISGMDNLEMLDLCADPDMDGGGFSLDFSDMEGLRSCEQETADLCQEQAQCHAEGASPFRLFGRAKPEQEYEQQQEDVQFPKLEMIPGPILGCTLDELRKDENRPGPHLRLNYEDVLNAWSERGMSWSDSRFPQTVPDDSNADSTVSSDMGTVPDLGSSVNQSGEAAVGGDEGCTGGGGREARVMRYREKRRTRLFSKKIRYEVRKLNAERRPRMKGRFVKRTS